QIATTLEEAFLGFLIGVALGVVFGVALGRVRLLSDVFAPYIKALNAMPRVVLGSIFIITIGYGIWSKVALAVVLVFFVVFFNAFQGVREVDRVLLNNARILGASERQLTTHVIFPSALSWILASLHTSFGFALVGAVVGEYLGAIHGIGIVIATAQSTFNPNGVFAAMLILALVAVTAEFAMTWLENRLIKWRPNSFTDIQHIQRKQEVRACVVGSQHSDSSRRSSSPPVAAPLRPVPAQPHTRPRASRHPPPPSPSQARSAGR